MDPFAKRESLSIGTLSYRSSSYSNRVLLSAGVRAGSGKQFAPDGPVVCCRLVVLRVRDYRLMICSLNLFLGHFKGMIMRVLTTLELERSPRETFSVTRITEWPS